MKIGSSKFRRSSSLRSGMIVVAVVIMMAGLSFAQGNASSVEAQGTAMKKLSFLEGRWSGPVTVIRGPGEPLHLTQTEDVEYKLNGLVMLVEGKSTDSSGKVVFNALATIAYDDASHAYHIRAYHDGHYLDTELSVSDEGFSWAFEAGPAHIVNTMHLTEKGEWSEITEASFGGGAPHRSVEMLLQHQR